MKKILMTVLISLISIFSYADSNKVIDFYVNTETGHLISNEHGVDVEEIVKDNQSTIYYNLQGHSSTHPFNGINIVKNNNLTYKLIIK